MKAIDHAQSFVTINKEEVKAIMHSRKSLLFNNTSVWVKREGDPDFDSTMGSFDGTEICELVGVYILNLLGEKYGKERVGLCRGDGLAYFENISGSQAEKIRKDVIKIFKEEFDLNITSETNFKIVIFLDVTLNLSTGKYQPYNKPDNDPIYIDVNSNHPPNITKNLPDSISKRINKQSSDEHIFNSTKDLYNNALKNSGYKQNIKFQHNVSVEAQKRKNNRGRKIIWFNPRYSCSIATDIGDKHFPKMHKFYKILNRNNVKVSYSSMPCISSIIKSHNKKVLSNEESKSSKSFCNCRDKSFCPLNGNYLKQNVIHCSKVILRNQYTNENQPHYIGLTESSFKDRLYKHKSSFKYKNKRNATELSNFIWDQKSKNIDVSLEWSILDKAKPYSPVQEIVCFA